jgi:hypothetical protein
MVSNVEEA